MANKSSIVAKLWNAVRYSNNIQNCGTCSHADDANWDNDTSECNTLSGITFPISRWGICKLHSSFNHGNLKHHI